MYRPSSRRRQLIARFIVYGLMTFLVTSIVGVLMLVILGYTYSKADGQIEQGGLLQFASIPSGAAVTLDGNQLGFQTPGRSGAEAKSHTVAMDLAGYRPWQKTIQLRAGHIGWLSYARLVPSIVTPEQLRVFPKLASSLTSSDRKWIVVLEDAASPILTLVNIEGTAPVYSSVTIPAGILTPAEADKPQQTYRLDSWSGDGRYVLVQRSFNIDKSEWLVVDREHPDKSLNVTSSFALGVTPRVVFGQRTGRDLFVQTDDIVRRVNLDDQTLSRPLTSNVEEFSVFNENTVVYTSRPIVTDANKRQVGYVTRDMATPQVLKTFTAETPNVHIVLADYFFTRYMAITHDQVMDLYGGDLPAGKQKGNQVLAASIKLVDPISTLTISRNGRFVAVQHPGSYTVYDIDLDRADKTVLKRPLAMPSKLKWLDDYMLWSDGGNMLRTYEFDSANQQDIMPVLEGQSVTASVNDKYIYGFATSTGGVAFERAKMTVQ